MEHITVSPPGSVAIDGKYILGVCLAERDDQAVYETTYHEEAAIIKIFSRLNSRNSADLYSALQTARALKHDNLLAIHDCGLTETDNGERIVYAVMERADETLAGVLRERTLDDNEATELINGLLPALKYLHARGFVHGHIQPANVFACGDRLKLSCDRLQLPDVPRVLFQQAGLRDAPETSTGPFGPQSDVYSLGVLILEVLTGSPLAKGVERLQAPFRQIVEGCLIRDPKERLRLEGIEILLRPQPVRQMEEPDPAPRVKGKGGIAIAAIVVAVAAGAFIVRGVHGGPAPAPVAQTPVARTEPVPSRARVATSDLPSRPSPLPAAKGAWAVVGAAYRRHADAEKRAASIRKSHPALNPVVIPTEPNAPRYLVVFGSGLSDNESERLLDRVRRSGAPPDSYRTQLR